MTVTVNPERFDMLLVHEPMMTWLYVCSPDGHLSGTACTHTDSAMHNSVHVRRLT